MTLSLNEVDALAKKASRGAGYSWGIAEEAGRAVRWLCSVNVDGCRALSKLLVQLDQADLTGHAPLLGDVWRARAGILCPLLSGPTLSDFAARLPNGPIRLERVAHPILLAPFAAMSAHALAAPVRLAWSSLAIETDGAAVVITGEIGAPEADVTVCIAEAFDHAAATPVTQRAQPDIDAFARLNAFAHRTYAPATDASRLLGAGAGLSDND